MSRGWIGLAIAFVLWVMVDIALVVAGQYQLGVVIVITGGTLIYVLGWSAGFVCGVERTRHKLAAGRRATITTSDGTQEVIMLDRSVRRSCRGGLS